MDRRAFVTRSAAFGAGMLAGATTAGAVAAAGGPTVPPPTYKDPLLNKPYIDVDEWRDQPFRHRYVHGGFTGADARFLIIFPPKERYQGRFFQHNTAIPTSELTAGNIFGGELGLAGFAFDSGGAAVVTNQGGFGGNPQYGQDTVDPTLGSYRVAAATAMYTRELAQQMYGPHRCFGYAFGGSGGGYRTMACAENTDAWEGTLPYIHGNAHAWPNSYAARARAQRTLKDKMPLIADAIEPGGGDIYAGLSPLQHDILAEVTRLGFPVRTWVFNDAMGIGPLTLLFQGIQTLDPEYFELFWKTPGFLGHDAPEQFADVRLQHRTKVKRVIMSDQAAALGLRPNAGGRGPNADPDLAWRNFQANYGAPLAVALELESLPPKGSFLDMANIDVASGDSAGKWLVLGALEGNFARLQFSPAGGSLRDITDHIKVGDDLLINNSNILAYETYYRHALLPREFYVDNQFRRPDGTPMYPQRPRLIAYELMKGATPTMPTGKYHGKMIVVQNLVDWDAQGWYADVYRTYVRQHLGRKFEDNYRLYFTDYATHGGVPDPTRIINYSTMLQQGLRDLAAWVERGVPAPTETRYRVENGQVIVPPTAAQRKGIQPVVTLKASGAIRTNAKIGEPVTFTAVIETPPKTGKVVGAEWAFETGPKVVASSQNRYTVTEQFAPAEKVTLTRQYTFTTPGTYYPAIRVYSHRQGDPGAAYARIPNLGRVRVVVT